MKGVHDNPLWYYKACLSIIYQLNTYVYKKAICPVSILNKTAIFQIEYEIWNMIFIPSAYGAFLKICTAFLTWIVSNVRNVTEWPWTWTHLNVLTYYSCCCGCYLKPIFATLVIGVVTNKHYIWRVINGRQLLQTWCDLNSISI